MHATRSRFSSLALLLAALALAGCGALNPIAAPTATVVPTATMVPTDTVVPTATTVPTPTTPPIPEGLVTSLDGVKNAVIYIEAQGSFVEPGVGLQLNAAGAGSGFIIDKSGIAVTNNHVVTGAAFLKVWIGGEGEPRNAKILGVSECSDLAVIDIDGDGYAYLEWYDGAITAGLDIYAAGFPLGDPEFTLTRGIVAKERASGETSWASVDAVIQHDASTNPGNSGGPIVTQDGKVVAVHYASNYDTSQRFAIGRDEALKVIDQLRAGHDVTSIGVNGTAVTDGQTISGIWVSSVKSGSPADRAGVKGGDLILTLEGLVLATDGTMSDYCDILRSHNPEDTLSIEVLRLDTGERLEGQLNGRQLQAVSIPVVPNSALPPEQPGALAYSDYVMITDDSGALQVEVPVEWNEVDGSAWVLGDQVIGLSVSASSDLDGFVNTFATPGVFFGASAALRQDYDVTGLLDDTGFEDDCTYDGRYDYDDGVYVGAYDLYVDCGPAGGTIVSTVAMPDDGSFLVWVVTQLVSEADVEALGQIFDTFEVVGSLP
jgi:serine protease Do